MTTIRRQQFESLSQKFEAMLVPLGFAAGRMVCDGPFGSHYSEYENGPRSYRLVWDGKESWLIAEYRDNLVSPDRWSDVELIRVGREVSLAELNSSSQRILNAVSMHVAAHAA